MESIYCPDCGSSELTENFICRKCRKSNSNGKKRSSKPNLKTTHSRAGQISVIARKTVKNRLGKIILFGSVALTMLTCLAIFSHNRFYSANAKNLKTINSQLFAQNDQNKFAVETNEKKNLTTVTLTQKNIKLQSGTKPPADIKLLYDCIIEGDALTQTPEEYHITILADEAAQKIFETNELQFETDKTTQTIKKQNGENWTNETDSSGYVTYQISRKELETIAKSSQTTIRIGEYAVQINFAQQQSIKSFLIATSIDSKVS